MIPRISVFFQSWQCNSNDDPENICCGPNLHLWRSRKKYLRMTLIPHPYHELNEVDWHRVKRKFNPFALRMAKTPWSFGRSECKRVKQSVYSTHSAACTAAQIKVFT